MPHDRTFPFQAIPKTMSDMPPQENEPVLPSSEPNEAVQVRPKRRKKSKPKHEPRYHVILWNDDVHTFDYVIMMLQALFGYPREKGRQLANEIHNRGRAVVYTSSLEKAEIKRDQILAFGPDPFAMEEIGPLMATLERDRED